MSAPNDRDPIPEIRRRLKAVADELRSLTELVGPYADDDEAWNAWDDLEQSIDAAGADVLDAMWDIERHLSEEAA